MPIRLFHAYWYLLAVILGTAFFLTPAAVGAVQDSQLPLALPEGPVILVVAGNIARVNIEDEAHFDELMLQALPTHTLHTHTVVTDGTHRFDGVLMRDLLSHVGAQGETVRALALNSYSLDIPVRDFHEFDVLLATHMDGQRLRSHNKGPLWIIYPRDQHRKLQDIRYDYRWVWQLHRLTVQ